MSGTRLKLIDLENDGDFDVHIIYYDEGGLPDKVYLNDDGVQGGTLGRFSDNGLSPEEGVWAAWAICADGRKVMLHLTLGNRESYPNWLEFLRDLVRRGLCTPVLIATDGAPGLIAAVEEGFPNSLRQRCLAHKTRNVTDKVPDSVRAEIKNAVRAAYYAPTRDVADMIAASVLETYQDCYPSAMRSFQDDWEACVAYLRCPAIHHNRIRTTNLLERSFLEQRRRTKVIPRFFTKKSCLKLVFATLWRASQRWQGVRTSEVERQQLKLLRRELGLLTDDKQDTISLQSRQFAAQLMPHFLQEISDLT